MHYVPPSGTCRADDTRTLVCTVCLTPWEPAEEGEGFLDERGEVVCPLCYCTQCGRGHESPEAECPRAPEPELEEQDPDGWYRAWIDGARELAHR